MTTTTFSIDLHFQPLHTANAILDTLYTQTSEALEAHNLVDAYCYMFIPVSKKAKIFTKVAINEDLEVQYFVAKNPKDGDYLPVLSYNQALNTLRSLLA